MPAPQPVCTGELIGIPLGDVTIVAVLAGVAADRAFLVCFGPPRGGKAQTVPSDYEAEQTSYFVAETVALYDGSWFRYGDAPPWALAQIVPVPRFKATLNDGRRVLVRLGEDLGPAELAESFDEAEFTEAPSFLPVAASLFEIAVANTFGIAAPAPPSDPEVDSKRRAVLKTLRELVSDPARALAFEHALRFDDTAAARAALPALLTDGYDVRPIAAENGRGITLEVVVPSVPEYPAVRRTIARLEALAAEFGGLYDGFGARPE